MENINKWYNDYIKNVDLGKMQWIKYNANELDSFLENNYLDREVWEYVHDENASSIFPTLLGMNYLSTNSPLNNKKYSFLLGIVDNNIGKKTVVAAAIYLDEYIIFTDQEIPITYISTLEVNSYFRNRGIYKKMCEVLINFINSDQHIVITKQTEMGAKCHVFDILRNTLISNKFHNYIFEDNHGMIHSELHDIICSKQKVLTKAKNNK